MIPEFGELAKGKSLENGSLFLDMANSSNSGIFLVVGEAKFEDEEGEKVNGKVAVKLKFLGEITWFISEEDLYYVGSIEDYADMIGEDIKEKFDEIVKEKENGNN